MTIGGRVDAWGALDAALLARWAGGAAAVVLLGFLAVAHTRFVRARHHLRESWSAIDVELRRRHDLVPALERVVEGHADHERRLLAEAAEARARAAAPHRRREDRLRDEDALADALGDIVAVAEDHPRLTADASYRELHDRLVEVEDRLASARRFHNGNVQAWHDLGGAFPWRTARWLVRWRPEPYVAIHDAARRRPSVADG